MSHAFQLTWDSIAATNRDLTIDELFAHYYQYARAQCRTHKNIAANYRRYFGPVGNMLARDLSAQHVMHWHSEIGKRFGKVTANHCLRLLRTIYNYGIRFNLYDGKNPATVIRQFPEKSRERFVTREEMPKFLETMEKLPARSRDFFFILLFTGARSGDVLSMRWEDINITEKVWIIRDSKNGDDLHIPLDARVLAALARCRRYSRNGWVFPSKKTVGHMWLPRRDWNILRKGFPDLRAHDLRRTLATWQLNTGTKLEVVGKTLGHRSIKSTEIYARMQVAPVRKAVDTALSAMFDSTSIDF
jgi:integrase